MDTLSGDRIGYKDIGMRMEVGDTALWRQKAFANEAEITQRFAHINVYFGFGQIHFLISCLLFVAVMLLWMLPFLLLLLVSTTLTGSACQANLCKLSEQNLAKRMERRLRSNPGWTETMSEVFMPPARTKNCQREVLHYEKCTLIYGKHITSHAKNKVSTPVLNSKEKSHKIIRI